ncbi:uncharacterized protein [Physcomitrium patens]|uniref:uncharacterized protein n=1 Tax=Physcomitrium patens TaxID=3218 RepID=UPI003CCD023C
MQRRCRFQSFFLEATGFQPTWLSRASFLTWSTEPPSCCRRLCLQRRGRSLHRTACLPERIFKVKILVGSWLVGWLVCCLAGWMAGYLPRNLASLVAATVVVVSEVLLFCSGG